MSGIFGGGTEIVQEEPRLSGVRIQSSSYGKARAWVRGKARLAGNLVWLGDFNAIRHEESTSSGKGGGVESTSVWYTYKTGVMIGLCAGEILEVRKTWRDKSVYSTPVALGFSTITGALGQAPWPNLVSKHPSQAQPYSGLAMAVVSSLDLGRTASLGNFSFEVVGALADGGMQDDANPRLYLHDFLTGADGVGFPASLLGDWSQFGAWCIAADLFMSPALTEQGEAREFMDRTLKAAHADWLWSDGVLKILPLADEAVTANGAAYVPAHPVVYDLTDDDFIGAPGEPPVHLIRQNPADAHNSIDVSYDDRALDYNNNVEPAKDDNAIADYGEKPAAEFKCDAKRASVASRVAHLRLRRMLNVRNKYRFTLMANKIGLEPGDLVTLTNARLGLDQFPVRILSMAESGEHGDLEIEAEEWPFEISGEVVYPTDPNVGYSPNFNAAAPDVNPPVIFEPPTSLSGEPQIWLATSGSADGWGGCDVFVSLDNLNYQRAGQITQPASHGVLTATLPTYAGNPDQVNTLSVDLSVSGGVINGGSTIDADSLVTLSWVGGELLSYRDATLTAANQYDLDYLVRGAYGSTVAAHAAGTAFVRLSESVLRVSYPPEWVGKTIYVKLLSFNEFGGGKQTLAEVSAYTHTVQGEALPAVAGLALEAPWTGRDVSIAWSHNTSARRYVVEIYSGATLRRTVGNLADPRFTYTFAMNSQDGLARTLTFKVYAESATGGLSLPSQIAAGNSQVAQPSGVTLIPGMGSVVVGTNAPTVPDYAGTVIYVSETSGFAPGAGTLAFDGANPGAPILNLSPGVPVYVRIAHYDAFGQDGLVFSSEVSTTPFAMAGGIDVVDDLPVTGLTDGMVVYLTTDKKLWRYDEVEEEWNTWTDGSDLLAASVTAGKISVSNLSAISASMGTITAGNFTVDAAGFIRGGASGFGSGSGFYLGYDPTASGGSGAYVAHLGDPSASHVAFNGERIVVDTQNFAIDGAGNVTLTGTVNANGGYFKGSIIQGDMTGYAWPEIIGERGTYIGPEGVLFGNDFDGSGFLGIDYATGTITMGGAVTVRGDIEATSIKADSAEIVSTIHLAGNSVSVMNSTSGTAETISTTLNVPDGQTMKIVAVASINGASYIVGDGGGFSGGFRTGTLTINGSSFTFVATHQKQTESDNATSRYIEHPASPAYEVSVTGPATVTVSLSLANLNSQPRGKTLVALGRMK